MNEKARKIQTKVTAALKSSRGQNVLLYLLFVAVGSDISLNHKLHPDTRLCGERQTQ